MASMEPDGRESCSATEFMVEESLVAWGGLLRGETVGRGLEHWVPALVGVLRDKAVRDALIAWICPGGQSLSRVDPALVDLMEVLLGPETRLAAGRRRGPPVRQVPREEALRLEAALAADWDSVDAFRFAQTRLEELCRLTPAVHAPPLLSVVASFAWTCGDGARARVAAELGLLLEPEDGLCRLVLDAVDRGVRPPMSA